MSAVSQATPQLRRWVHRRSQWGTALVLLLPALAVFAVFTAYPFFYAARLSLLEWDGLSADPRFVGLDNYRDLLASPDFRNSLKVTAIYTLATTVISIALGLLLAVALNRRLLGRNVYRTLFFTPVLTATVAAAVVWMLLFDPYTGVVNIGLRESGLPAPGWLADPDWALPAIVVVGVWKRIGFVMVIYLAGLQSISPMYYEAARVDGASGWRQFWDITWPLLTPITVLQTIMAVIDSFQVFDHVFVMTKGGPLGATDVLPMYLYRQGFEIFHLGTAAAVGWVIFIVIFTATVLQWVLTRGGGWRR
ncbi:MAG TPA: sugar ABC transporter permease [Gaiellaceae bacterium]|jgi:multiple sugar transport system permease protein|nr:sugar ABC transporter permease [Gaiellaceae bacterium]